MRIEAFGVRHVSGMVVADANVIWETADRPPLTVFEATAADTAAGFWSDPNAFLIGAFLPAWHAGESHVSVDAPICPILVRNLRAAAVVLRDWYPELGAPPSIRTSVGYEVRSPVAGPSLAFLSGGVDSMAMLRANHSDVPRGHPAFIGAALSVDFSWEPGVTLVGLAKQERLRSQTVAAVAADLGITAMDVKTNMLALDEDGNFYSYKWHGAVLAAIAHLFSKGYPTVHLASSHLGVSFIPWGSHMALDGYFSSGHLRVIHEGMEMPRLQKVAMVAEWPFGLDQLLVCQGQRAEDGNCGGCEKCIRTMTALVSLGRLKGSAAFPVDDVSSDLLATVHRFKMVSSARGMFRYTSLVPGLVSQGRDDLVSVIDDILQAARARDSRRARGLLPLEDLIGHGDAVVFADGHDFGGKVDRYSNGHRWGPPTDGPTAIRELESLRGAGFDYLVLPKRTNWWLEHYEGLAEHLQSRYPPLVDAAGLVAFDLRAARQRA